MEKNGIILLDKEAGLTSRDVDNRIMKLLDIKKVGHLGTLDPFATGLLVVAINKGTKFLPFLDSSQKSYIATLKLGESTTSGDPETPVFEKKDVPELNDPIIKTALASFLGGSMQTPPMTSAIKKDGVELYKLAHEGKEVARAPRPIHIYSLNEVSYKDKTLIFTCTVSEGTYIRTLGQDIAKKLGTVGFLTALRRLSVGPFMVNMAMKIEKLDEKAVLDPTIFMTNMKHVEIDSQEVDKIKNGMKIDLKENLGDKVLLTLHGEPLSVYEREQGTTKYHCLRGLF